MVLLETIKKYIPIIKLILSKVSEIISQSLPFFISLSLSFFLLIINLLVVSSNIIFFFLFLPGGEVPQLLLCCSVLYSYHPDRSATQGRSCQDIRPPGWRATRVSLPISRIQFCCYSCPLLSFHVFDAR